MKATLWALAALLTAATAQAQGVLLVQEQTIAGTARAIQIQIDPTHMRVESYASGHHTAMVFDGTAQVMRTLDLDKKTYSEVDQAQLQKLQQQMAQMQEQMKNIPPAQRAMMEKMMRGRGPGAAPTIQYRQTGSDTVGSWSCTSYEGYSGEEKAVELCTVPPATLGLKPTDFDVAKRLAEFVRAIVPNAANQSVLNGTEVEQGFNGIPVRQATYDGGRVALVTVLKEVRRVAFPASTWEVPEGFQKLGAAR